jgi:8-oxo-dGTP diphosphatase
MAITIFNVGVKGLIVDGDKVLIVKSSSHGFWEAPGGRVDNNETIQETLIRELQEELPGIENIKIGRLLNAYRLPGMPLGDRGLTLMWYVVHAEFPDDVGLSDEHEQFEWVSFAEALNRVETGTKQAIEAYTS